MPALHRPRRAARDRPRPARARPVASRSPTARSCRGRSASSSFYEARDPGDRRPLRDRRRPAVAGADRGAAELFLYGTNGDRVSSRTRNRMGRKRQYTMAFEGIVAQPRAALPRDRLAQQRERIEEYMSFRPVPGLQGRAAQAGRCSRSRSGTSRSTSSRGSRSPARSRFLDELELTETEQLIGAAHRQGDPRAAHVPRRRRRRLPPARPRRGDAVGRRGAAAPARDADRLAARRRALHPRRAVDRAAPARQRPADRHARAAARPRQHRARRRARRADDARRRLARRHGPGRRRARRPGRRRGHRRSR